MTAPNLTSATGVTGAANYSGLAAFAAKTQADWEAGFKSPFETTATNILNGLWGDLPKGAEYGLTLVTEIVRQLIQDPEAVFTTVTDAIGAIGTWVLDLVVGGVSAVLQQIDAFFTNIPNLETWLSTFQTLIDGLLGITNFGTWVDTFKTLINGLLGITNFETWISTFKTLINGLLGITNFSTWVATFKQVTDFFNGIGSGLLAGFLSAIETVVNFFKGIIDNVGSLDDWLADLPVIGDVLDVINSITGGAFTAISDGITGLVAWAQKLPVVGSLVASLLGNWVNPVTGTNNTLPDLIAYAAKLVTDESVLLAQNILGFIPFELMSLIPTGFIGNTAPNLVTDQGFSSSAVLQTGNGWTWDNTNNVDSSGGSAKVVGDGGVKQLFSNLIAVTAGQTLSVSTSVKWTKGLTATPTLLIGLRGYNDAEATTFTWTVSSIVGKSGSLNSTVDNSYNVGTNTTATFSNGWVKIAGTSQAIPAGTTQVRVLLGMTNGPSGTTAWFDDVYAGKTQLLGQDLIHNLTDSLASLLPATTYQQLMNVLGKTPGANLSDVISTITSFLTGSSALNGNNILSGNISSARIQELIDTWIKTILGIKIDSAPTTATPADVTQALNDFAKSMAAQGSRIQTSETSINDLKSRMAAVETAINSTPNGINARLTALETKANFSPVTPPPTGSILISVFDDFERSLLGSNWTYFQINSDGSSLGIPNGHDAKFTAPSVSSVCSQVAVTWNGTGKAANTQYQRIYTTLGSSPSQPALGTGGFNDLIAKASPTDPRVGIVCRFYADGVVKIFYRTGAWEADGYNPSNLLGTFTSPIRPTTGTQLEFYAGDKSVSDQTKCYAKVGTAVLGPAYISAGALAALGTGWGFGMGNGLSLLAPQVSGSLNYWGAQDQV